jgi:hypothetical protein
MPALGAGIHVFLSYSLRRGWHRNSGLPELRTIECRKSGKPDLRDEPGHDAVLIRVEWNMV